MKRFDAQAGGGFSLWLGKTGLSIELMAVP
jgi:hypothetical protein